MVRERCSCGAEFETDEKGALQLLKSWRVTHLHQVSESATFVNVSSQIEQSGLVRDPELQIGFRSEEE